MIEQYLLPIFPQFADLSVEMRAVISFTVVISLICFIKGIIHIFLTRKEY